MIMKLKGVLGGAGLSSANRRGVFALVAGLTMISSAMGEPLRIQARQDAQTDGGVPSYFQLNFFDQDDNVVLGNPAFIASTRFELELDSISGTARFLSYEQDVDPLFLPDGFGGVVSTGALRIEIIESEGTYDRTTGTFVTSDTYRVHYENDLSFMGLPPDFVDLEDSESGGILSLQDYQTGHVAIDWGRDVFDHETIPFDFSYICSLSAVFSTTASSYVEIEMVPLVASTPMSSEALRDTLMTYLDSAIAAFAVPNVRSGVNSLRTFAFKVERSRGLFEDGNDASDLIAAANTAIRLAENRLDQVMRGSPQDSSIRGPEGAVQKNTMRDVR